MNHNDFSYVIPDSLCILQGGGITVKVVNKSNREGNLVSVREDGIVYKVEDRNGDFKTQFIPKRDYYQYKFRIYDPRDNRETRDESIKAWDFCRTLSTVIESIRKIDVNVPKGDQTSSGIFIDVLWPDSMCPTLTPIHCFYDDNQALEERVIRSIERFDWKPKIIRWI